MSKLLYSLTLNANCSTRSCKRNSGLYFCRIFLTICIFFNFFAVGPSGLASFCCHWFKCRKTEFLHEEAHNLLTILIGQDYSRSILSHTFVFSIFTILFYVDVHYFTLVWCIVFLIFIGERHRKR